MTSKEMALLDLGRELLRRKYSFVTPTPATLARIHAREISHSPDLRNIFGESRPFQRADLDPPLFAALESAGMLETSPEGIHRAKIRYSTIAELLLVHSAYPTEADDSVFFGPDTYRFVRLLESLDIRGRHVFDVGTGTGAGAYSLRNRVEHLTLGDVNPHALLFSRVNAELNGISAERIARVLSDGLEALDDPRGPVAHLPPPDWIITNPPFIIDPHARAYRHGGGLRGAELSLRWTAHALEHLGPGGRFVMYTGATIVHGHDELRAELFRMTEAEGMRLDYAEIDPDIFGEELDHPVYADADRIAAVAAIIRKSPSR